jgi:S-disulfanyl-L-cysteine oxidoreductase SoxD
MECSRSNIIRGTLASVLMIAATAPVAAAQQPSAAVTDTPSASRGAYTEAQAARGESTYRASCTSCHATSAYVGDAFVRAWAGRTAFDLFELIRTTMPNDNPGRLSRQEYADIVAYMFKLNRFPPGERPLPTDDEGLKQVRIEAKPASTP